MTEASSMPAGWYHAQGDPVGTHRYWDGSQWVGEPQPVAGAPTAAYGAPATAYGTPVPAVGSNVVPADLGPRIIAFLIDTGLVIAAAVVWGILIAVAAGISDGAAGLMVFIGLLAFLAFTIWNFIIRQGNTGQTLGKQMQNVKLVDLATNQPVGIGKAFVRSFLPGILNTLTFGVFGLLDIMWPFFDHNRQRIIDKIISANVTSA